MAAVSPTPAVTPRLRGFSQGCDAHNSAVIMCFIALLAIVIPGVLCPVALAKNLHDTLVSDSLLRRI